MARAAYLPEEHYVGNGSLAAYDFDFKITSLDQLLVVEYDDLGVETQRVRGTDVTYIDSVVFDAEEGGGTVTLAANLTNLYELKILLADDEPTQPYEFRNKGDFTLKRIENAFDFLAGAVQRLTYLASRSIKINDWEQPQVFDTQLPDNLQDYAGRAIIINDAGTGLDLGANPAATIEELIGDVTTGAVAVGVATATIANNAVTNVKAADMATATIKGRTTAGTGDPEDLTVTQATAMLNAVVGDSGSGGTKGLVPAPGAGDAAAAKFLKADGTWVNPGGGGGGGLRIVEGAYAPIMTFENGIEVYEFEPGGGQQLFLALRVPASYSVGLPIKLRILWTCAATSGDALIQAVATLIGSTDEITSTTNQRTTTNAAITMSAANDLVPQQVILDISSSIGEINAVDIGAGDLIKVTIQESSSTVASTIKFIPDAMEVTHS